MKEKIKELRVKIDGLAQLTEGLRPLDALWGNPDKAPENAAFKHIMVNSKEVNRAVDSLYLAKAWLGKVLEELNVESPYKSGYKTVEDIKPTADVREFRKAGIDYEFIIKEGEDVYWKDLSHIEKVDWLREEIKQTIKSLPETKPSSRYEAIAWTNTYNYLCEARFHLGFELQRIKENK